jgi:NTP pyrophosphatase (non-canonical NTP hydrolase)
MPENIFDKIINWAVARNLIEGATPAAQFEKLAEEFGELGRALIEGDQAKFEDAVGDMVVVLTILAAQRDTNIEKCIAGAYDEIKDRTGKMVDGKFVKDAK